MTTRFLTTAESEIIRDIENVAREIRTTDLLPRYRAEGAAILRAAADKLDHTPKFHGDTITDESMAKLCESLRDALLQASGIRAMAATGDISPATAARYLNRQIAKLKEAIQ